MVWTGTNWINQNDRIPNGRYKRTLAACLKGNGIKTGLTWGCQNHIKSW